MIAVVTGSSSGIGRATALEFARRGWNVAVLARRKELLDTLVDEMKAAGPKQKYLAVACDVSEWKQIQDAADKVTAELGVPTVLVNNAGAFEYASLEKSSPEKLEEMVDVNVRGVIYVTKAFLASLKKASSAEKPARIINVSSISGLWGFSNMAIYTASKFAVTGFSSALQRELKNQNIIVSSIHPGPVRTKGPADAPKKTMTMLPDQIAKQILMLATSHKRRHISHPAFSILNLVEQFSPTLVDRVLKKIL